ncbi:uncharacterized protein J4E87_006369 [Alternaria ethzedia]|uniref:uncharacterized protein n=1 Tax=Alternaria ethzedia TaxID=181014 RepID=UPI0020C1F0F3|nr:uncharacterized protein J4E87_006369 [Alternaria ethzedia]KAI4622427.1 hypothetical protein J4E87_006369 [Alternaria ethzedia]
MVHLWQGSYEAAEGRQQQSDLVERMILLALEMTEMKKVAERGVEVFVRLEPHLDAPDLVVGHLPFDSEQRAAHNGGYV